jgi:hypothetical protein
MGVQVSTVILEWTFSPANYFEEPIEIHRDDYVMTIADGKAEARVATDVFDRDPSIRQLLHNGLNDRLLGAQLLMHQAYSLSKSSMVRVDDEGRRHIFLEVSVVCGSSVGSPDLLITDKHGNVVLDTRKDRIEKKKSLFELIEKHRAKDALLDAMLRSHQGSVGDPDNELVHLYEIRDTLSKKFGGDTEACSAIGIKHSDWKRLGGLANGEPLRQGRHRGFNAGALRDATEAELGEGRRIARLMVEGYLEHLQRVSAPVATTIATKMDSAVLS